MAFEKLQSKARYRLNGNVSVFRYGNGPANIRIPRDVADQLNIVDKCDVLVDRDVTPAKVAIVAGTTLSLRPQGNSKSAFVVASNTLNELIPVTNLVPVKHELATIGGKRAAVFAVPAAAPRFKSVI